MPRVSIYRGNAVQREGTTGAKFVPADYGPSALGEGLQRAGQALGQYAEREDQIQSLYDEQDANRLDLEHAKQTQVLSDRLREARGAGAREAADALAAELESFNSSLLQRARSPRARMALESSVQRRTLGEVDRYQAYADGEFVQDFRATNDASVQASLERATDIEDDDLAREELESTAFDLIQQRAQFEGWSGGAEGLQAQQYRLRVTNAYHTNRARTIARDDPMAAIDYAVSHRDEMTDDSLSGILDSLNSEALEQRMTAFVDGAPEFAAPPEEGPAPEPRDETPIAYTWNVTSGMGARRAPTAGASTNHPGIDYEAAAGTAVPVTLSGRVTFAGRRGGYGNMVEVSHGNGLTTRYAHLSRMDVRVGQSVGRGTNIGAVGATGRVTGPHLHYEMRRDGQPINPRSISSTRVHPGGTQGAAQGADIDAQVAAIRGNETLSWREKQAAEAVVRRRHGEARAARADRENEADRAAAAQVAELGEGFTSMSQINTTGMSPRDVLSYSNMARANRQRAEAERENQPPSPELMLWINYQRFANPGFYMSEQFLQQARQQGASAGMLREIAGQQGAMLGTRIPADRSRIWSIANPILQEAGIDLARLDPAEGRRDPNMSAAERQEDARRKNALLANIEQLHNIWVGANPGAGAPPDEVVREWVARSVMQTGSGGSFSLLTESDAQLMERLHPRDRARAEQALRSANLPINAQTIAMAVRQRLARTRRTP